jgi:hypothetical protein
MGDGGELPVYRITTTGINWLNSMIAKRKKIQGTE